MVLPGDEHPRPGRALRDRDGHRHRHRQGGHPRRRRRAARATRRTTSSCAATRSSAASTPRTRRRTSRPRRARSARTRSPTGPGVRVDSGLEAGRRGHADVRPDGRQAHRLGRRPRAGDRSGCSARSREYEIEGLKTLIPFHTALLATEQWANAETARDLLEDKNVAEGARVPEGREARRRRGRRRPSSTTYTVEVSGRRFDVKVIGAAFGGGAVAARGRRAGAARKPQPKRGERKSGGGGGGGDTLELAAAGQRLEGPRRAGPDGRGGPARHDHRGDEDGERDHRPQGGRDRGAADQGGRAGRRRRHPRGHHARTRAELDHQVVGVALGARLAVGREHDAVEAGRVGRVGPPRATSTCSARRGGGSRRWRRTPPRSP